MRPVVRAGVVSTAVVLLMLGGVASAVSTALPTEFTSGGVLWGQVSNTGFYNEASVCLDGPEGFGQGDANLLSPDKADTFDDAGLVNVDGTYYVVPGGTNGPVDLSGSTLTAPVAGTGSLNVGVQWQGAGAQTIRELVTLTNPGATDLTKDVVVESNLGSDFGTLLQASSTGDISGYPTTARWFATSDSDTTPSDPTIVSVATGPGTVRSPAVIQDCGSQPESLAKQALEDAKNSTSTGSSEETTSTTTYSGADTSTTTDSNAEATTNDTEGGGGTVSATGTALFTDDFAYHYSVTIPAGQTRYVMVFWSLFGTNGEAVAAGPTWNTNPAANSAALAGLSPAVLANIVNWTFPLQAAFTG